MKPIEVLTYVEGEDPVKLAFDAVGRENLDKIEVFNNRVLVATAPHLERSKGGLIFTNSTIDENRYQEKVGIVLKCGDTAFEGDDEFKWPNPPSVGSLVFYRVTDSMEIGVNGVSCRFIADYSVIGTVSDLGVIW
ncbi:MAG: hypothetical protein P8Y47_04855 [Alphaproteobacteria bacterium]